MRYFYSPSENLFYVEDWESDYGISWPQDCISITEMQFIEFSSSPPVGKIRVSGIDGYPAWEDTPLPTQEEQIAVADAEKQRLIDQANAYMNSKQWPGKAALGRLKGDELAQYNLWLDYLDALESVDTSSAPDIEWPTPPEVPAR